ncbi:MAG: hypothetical protein H0V43_08130 [Gemmatimonadales bacterium]|nr:hypothetical protein [Gemmatimonadales bacterium]
MARDGFGRYPIQDAKVLRALTEKLVEHYGQGSLRKAAKKIGLTQPTLYRLHEGVTRHASQTTMRQLESAILTMNKQLHKQLLLAVMPNRALWLFRRGFTAWCLERQSRLVRRRGQNWHRERGKSPRPSREQWRRSGPSADLTSTYEQARRECPDVFKRFERFVDRKGIPLERCKVALVRIVEPLAETSASAFFEPRWIDLSPRQRRQFLEAGRRREEILLSREHPQIHANLLAKGQDPVGDRIWEGRD